MKNFNKLFLKHAKAIDGWGKPKKYELAHGHCAYWAYVFIKLYGGQACTLTDDKLSAKRCQSGHVIVFKNGLYYDGDHPQGVKDYRKLDSGRLKRHRSFKSFARYWYAFDESYKNEPLYKIFDKVAFAIKKDKAPIAGGS